MSGWSPPPQDGSGGSQPWAGPGAPGPPQWGAPGQGPPGQFNYGAPPTWEQPRTSGTAIASLVLGLLWLCGVGSLLAVILGFVARSKINSSQGRRSGGGLATAGIVLGVLGLLATGGTYLAIRNAPPEFFEGLNVGYVSGMLDEAAKLQEQYREDNDEYASDPVALFEGDITQAGIDFDIVRASATTYCMEASRGDVTMYRAHDTPVARRGSCPPG